VCDERSGSSASKKEPDIPDESHHPSGMGIAVHLLADDTQVPTMKIEEHVERRQTGRIPTYSEAVRRTNAV
jgi:hypothetical protein